MVGVPPIQVVEDYDCSLVLRVFDENSAMQLQRERQLGKHKWQFVEQTEGFVAFVTGEVPLYLRQLPYPLDDVA